MELLEQDLRHGKKTLHGLGPISVVFCDGKWFTRNIRRLFVIKSVYAGGLVPVVIGAVDKLFRQHNTTMNRGVSVRIRRRRPQSALGQKNICRAIIARLGSVSNAENDGLRTQSSLGQKSICRAILARLDSVLDAENNWRRT